MLLLLLLRRRLLLLLRLLVEQNVPVVCTRGSGAQLWDQTHSKKSAPGHTAGRTPPRPPPPPPPPHPTRPPECGAGWSSRVGCQSWVLPNTDCTCQGVTALTPSSSKHTHCPLGVRTRAT